MDLLARFGGDARCREAPLAVLPSPHLPVVHSRVVAAGRLLSRIRSNRRLETKRDFAGAILLLLDGAVGVRQGRRVLWGIPALHEIGVAESIRDAEPLSSAVTTRAVLYGEHLLPSHLADLTGRLYRYGTWPCSPRLTARFRIDATARTTVAVSEALQRCRSSLSSWIMRGPDESSRWFAWIRAGIRSRARRRIYKLFVSPEPGSVALAVEALLTAPSMSGAIGFKLGADLPGLLRPDRLVAYFPSRDALRAASAEIAPRLSELRGHGVPFAAPLDADGLLSWGVDVPSATGGLRSWRARMAHGVARSLILARASATDPSEVARFALARFAVETAIAGIQPTLPQPVAAA